MITMVSRKTCPVSIAILRGNEDNRTLLVQCKTCPVSIAIFRVNEDNRTSIIISTLNLCNHFKLQCFDNREKGPAKCLLN